MASFTPASPLGRGVKSSQHQNSPEPSDILHDTALDSVAEADAEVAAVVAGGSSTTTTTMLMPFESSQSTTPGKSTPQPRRRVTFVGTRRASRRAASVDQGQSSTFIRDKTLSPLHSGARRLSTSSSSRALSPPPRQSMQAVNPIFTPPTMEDVSSYYLLERGKENKGQNASNASAFLETLNSPVSDLV